jgi:hypothetical protein
MNYRRFFMPLPLSLPSPRFGRGFAICQRLKSGYQEVRLGCVDAQKETLFVFSAPF